MSRQPESDPTVQWLDFPVHTIRLWVRIRVMAVLVGCFPWQSPRLFIHKHRLFCKKFQVQKLKLLDFRMVTWQVSTTLSTCLTWASLYWSNTENNYLMILLFKLLIVAEQDILNMFITVNEQEENILHQSVNVCLCVCVRACTRVFSLLAITQ